MTSPRIALTYGQWGQNIGNAFFNLGSAYALREATDSPPFLVQDLPGLWTLHRKSRGNFRNWWNWLDSISTEYLVAQGPVLSTWSCKLWDEAARRLRHSGIRLGLLSAGLFTYSELECRAAVQFCEAVEPDFIATRDDRTHDVLVGRIPSTVAIHRGIDTSSFLPSVYTPPRMGNGNFTVVALDTYIEPPARQLSDLVDCQLQLASRFTMAPPPLSRVSARGTTAALALRALLPTRRASGIAAGMRIVRLDHRTNPHLPRLIYRKPNGIASDEPYTYVTLYANAVACVTDRVHAAACRLTYGKPVVFYSHTGRAALLDVLSDAEDLGGGWQLRLPVANRITSRQADLIAFLGSHLSSDERAPARDRTAIRAAL